MPIRYGGQPQLLHRPLYPPDRSAGGDLRGLGQQHLTGLHAKLKKEKILIPEEWLLYPFKEAEVKDVPELLEDRKKVLLPV